MIEDHYGHITQVIIGLGRGNGNTSEGSNS